MCISIKCCYTESQRLTNARVEKGDQSELSIDTTSGKCSGLIVSALDSMLRGPCLRPGPENVLCSWARHFTVTVPP